MSTKWLKTAALKSIQSVLSSPPRNRPLRPTSTKTKSSKMAQIHHVGYMGSILGNHCSYAWRDILSWPKFNIYIEKQGRHVPGTFCTEVHINTKEKLYEHAPHAVEERDDVTILWYMPVQRGSETGANRRDIVIKGKKKKKKKSCLFINLTIPNDRNSSVK